MMTLAATVALGFVFLTTMQAPGDLQIELPKKAQFRLNVVSPLQGTSPQLQKSLIDVIDLTEADAAQLERQLNADPENVSARFKLMAYDQRADRAADPENRARRFQNALWMIEHHPEFELLHSQVLNFSSGEISLVDYRRAVTLWGAASSSHANDATVQWNAAGFFEGVDSLLHRHYLEATVAADPNHPKALRPLAHLYALAILDGGASTTYAEAALEASKNVWILGNAAYMLQSQFNRLLQAGQPTPRLAEAAERYFLRAKAIDPNLDRQAILPQIDLKEIERAWRAEAKAQLASQARFDDAVDKIRRLPIDAFPQLPATIAKVLIARKCTVPQPYEEEGSHNVIRGQFFAAGQNGWAVLCSVNRSTTLLAFRNDDDNNPDTISSGEDRDHLQGVGGDKISYSRKIASVDRAFILRHYHAYGGAAPPPIEHQAIDDAFIGKASLTMYFHQGKWIGLQGAD